eukprot:COSAG02_NODE_1424_length_12684_cov_13.471116_16_plen_69_part_00
MNLSAFPQREEGTKCGTIHQIFQLLQWGTCDRFDCGNCLVDTPELPQRETCKKCCVGRGYQLVDICAF